VKGEDTFKETSMRSSRKRYTLGAARSLILAIIALGCASGDESGLTTPVQLQGKWIDVTTKTDTLTFDHLDDLELMSLSRGLEVRNGHLLPKLNAGPYLYQLTGNNTISLYWMLSSNSQYHDYYFNQNGAKLMIGDFFESKYGVRVFRKLN
jgi:hypothetical protein